MASFNLFKRIISPFSRYFAARMNPALKAKKEGLKELQEALFKNKDIRHIQVPTDDGEILDGIWVGSKSLKKAIVLCIGQGGQYEQMQEHPHGDVARFIRALRNRYPDYAAIYVNPRGVGLSTGYPQSTEDMKKDIDGVLNYLRTVQGVEDLVIWGHSLGCMTAIQTNEKVVLDRPFKSISTMVNKILGFSGVLTLAVQMTISAISWEYDLTDRLSKLDKEKVRVIYSEEDTIIPPHCSLGVAFKEEPFVIKMEPRGTTHRIHVAHLNDRELAMINFI